MRERAEGRSWKKELKGGAERKSWEKPERDKTNLRETWAWKMNLESSMQTFTKHIYRRRFEFLELLAEQKWIWTKNVCPYIKRCKKEPKKCKIACLVWHFFHTQKTEVIEKILERVTKLILINWYQLYKQESFVIIFFEYNKMMIWISKDYTFVLISCYLYNFLHLQATNNWDYLVYQVKRKWIESKWEMKINKKIIRTVIFVM